MSLLRALVVCFLVFAGACVHAASIAQYDFTGGSTNSTDTDPFTTAGPFYATGFTNGPTFLNDRVELTTDMMPAVLGTAYFYFTVTPDTNYLMSIASFSFTLEQKDNSYTAFWAIRSSQDSYAADLASGSLNLGNLVTNTPAISGLDNLTTPTTFQLRFADDRSNGSAKPLYFDSLRVNATVTVIPEPRFSALAAFGLVIAGLRAGRNYLARRRSA